MSGREFKGRFQSAVATLMEQFVQEKQACGYRYGEKARILACFDRFLCEEAQSQCELPRSLTRKWLAKQSHESASTHQCRIYAVRQFATYICRLGYAADVPDRSLTAKRGVVSHHVFRHLPRCNSYSTPLISSHRLRARRCAI